MIRYGGKTIMVRTITFSLRVVLLVSLLWAALPSRAFAAGVVGTGTPASCTEAALIAALAGGGTITFNCGVAPHTILSSAAKSITLDTTIDGGGTITLDGQDSDRLFKVSDSAVLTLRNIVLDHGFAAGDGGAIHNGSAGADKPGAVILENSTIRNSIAGQSGGAIVSTGPLTITNSLLEGNSALNGGALYPRFASARTTIINSTLRSNHATDATNGWGGAMLAWDGASVTIDGGEILSNTARTGGGIYNHAAGAASTLEMQAGTVLRGNVASGDGGGIFSAGVLTLTTTLLENNAAYRGAGLFHDGPAVTLTDSTFRDNSALGAGGGLFSNSGETQLINVVFRYNVAEFRGGGIYNHSMSTYLTDVTLDGNSVSNLFGLAGAWGGGVLSDGSVWLENVSLSGNTVNSGSGGGLYNLGTAYLTNVTASGNSASYYGGGIGSAVGSAALSHVTLSGNIAGISGGGLSVASGNLVVLASLVANSPSGGNCAGTITNLGFNLSTDGSCGFNTAGNLLLGPLADNGGPTQTHMPQPGSPAIDFAAVGCPPPSTDQRGLPRPVDGDGNGSARCDAGAVEVGGASWKLYGPLIIR
jgi:predicted outer membrane repeat protein